MSTRRHATLSLALSLTACGGAAPDPQPAPEPAQEAAANPLRDKASAIFGELPEHAANPQNPDSEAKVALGRTLYFDPRLSRGDDVSCNSCHDLARHGVDGRPTSPGDKGQLGGRNSPTVYNAALHLAQFWDGRSPDVEDQAKGPVLNPVEMAMPDGEAVIAKLSAVEGYEALFAAAFPEDSPAMTYDNLGRAIGAFERHLLTPAPFDAWLAGDDAAMSEAQLQGLQTFVDAGCVTCHMGPAVGGGMYQKLGLIRPYPTADAGRFDVTANEADRHVFKVPSLRNIAKTGPYLHDGSVADLDEAIRLMGAHQLGKDLSEAQVAQIHAFLDALTGELPTELIAPPKLPGT